MRVHELTHVRCSTFGDLDRRTKKVLTANSSTMTYCSLSQASTKCLQHLRTENALNGAAEDFEPSAIVAHSTRLTLFFFHFWSAFISSSNVVGRCKLVLTDRFRSFSSSSLRRHAVVGGTSTSAVSPIPLVWRAVAKTPIYDSNWIDRLVSPHYYCYFIIVIIGHPSINKIIINWENIYNSVGFCLCLHAETARETRI